MSNIIHKKQEPLKKLMPMDLSLQRQLAMLFVGAIGGKSAIHEGGDPNKPKVATLIDVHFNGMAKKLPRMISNILSKNESEIQSLFSALQKNNQALYGQFLQALEKIKKTPQGSLGSLMTQAVNHFIPGFKKEGYIDRLRKTFTQSVPNTLSFAREVCDYTSMKYVQGIYRMMQAGYQEQGMMKPGKNNSTFGQLIEKVGHVIDCLVIAEKKDSTGAIRSLFESLANWLMGITDTIITPTNLDNNDISAAITKLQSFATKQIQYNNGLDEMTFSLWKSQIINAMYSHMTLFSPRTKIFFDNVLRDHENHIETRGSITQISHSKTKKQNHPDFIVGQNNLFSSLLISGAIALDANLKTPESINSKGMDQPDYDVDLHKMVDLSRGRWLIDQTKSFGILKEQYTKDTQGFSSYLQGIVSEQELNALFAKESISGPDCANERKMVYRMISCLALKRLSLDGQNFSIKDKGVLGGDRRYQQFFGDIKVSSKATDTGYMDIKAVKENTGNEAGRELQFVAVQDNVNEDGSANHLLKEIIKQLTGRTRSAGYIRRSDLVYKLTLFFAYYREKYTTSIEKLEKDLVNSEKQQNLLASELLKKIYHKDEMTKRLMIGEENNVINLMSEKIITEDVVNRIINMMIEYKMLYVGAGDVYRTSGAAKTAQALGKVTPGFEAYHCCPK